MTTYNVYTGVQSRSKIKLIDLSFSNVLNRVLHLQHITKQPVIVTGNNVFACIAINGALCAAYATGYVVTVKQHL